MARVRPFHAIHYLNRRAERLLDPTMRDARERRLFGQRDPFHPIHLSTAPNALSQLRCWVAQGELARAEYAALHVLEIEPAPLERVYQPVTRMLIGLLDPADTLPLEEGHHVQRVAEPAPMEALVPDDHHVLRQLLEASLGNLFPIHETKVPGRTYRLFRVDQGPLVKRLLAALGELPVRPVRPLASEGSTLAAIYPMSEPGLALRPVHRAIQNVATFEAGRFLTLVREYARLIELDDRIDTPAGLAIARERLATLAVGHHAVLVVLPEGRGTILRFRQALDLTQVRAPPKTPTLRSLDLALLQSLVLRTVLGIEEPDRVGHPQVFGVGDLEELVAGVQTGLFQAGFALNPPPLWEVRAVIAAGQQLPPRTLEVSPAPPPGIVFFDPEQP